MSNESKLSIFAKDIIVLGIYIVILGIGIKNSKHRRNRSNEFFVSGECFSEAGHAKGEPETIFRDHFTKNGFVEITSSGSFSVCNRKFAKYEGSNCQHKQKIDKKPQYSSLYVSCK